MKQVVLAALMAILLGCSAVGAGIAKSMLGGGDAPSLDAEVTVGKKQEEVNVDVGKKVNNDQTAEVIYNQTEEFDPILLVIFMIIAIAGWVLPTPMDMWRKRASSERKI